MDDKGQFSFLSQQKPAWPTPEQGRGYSDNRPLVAFYLLWLKPSGA